MRSDVAEDFDWQTRFRGHYRELAYGVVRVNVASWDDDLRRNTDMQIATLENGHRIMCRARRFKHAARYGDQFTVRLSRPSGAKTEMAKIREGWGDFGIYGFESQPGAARLRPWVLYNVHRLREYLEGGGRWIYRDNRDGSGAFAAFVIHELPLGFVLNRDDWPLNEPLGKCVVCGGPAWLHGRRHAGRPCHACCDALDHPPCPSCGASDQINHYRYGWPRGGYR